MRTIGNLVTGDDETTEMVLSQGLLQHLKSLVIHPSKMVRKEACWTISNITAGTADQIRQIYECGLLQSCCSML